VGRTFYAGSLTIPASTTWSAPEELVLQVSFGTILEWYIKGMLEHQRQVSVAIYYLGHRIFPEGEGEYFYPSEHPGVFKVETKMTPGARSIVVRGANTDDTYEHTVYVGVVVETATPRPSFLGRVYNSLASKKTGEE